MARQRTIHAAHAVFSEADRIEAQQDNATVDAPVELAEAVDELDDLLF
jgi:hypothetical protein